tara:strand:+ start:918 stop:2795 length:1878 start_codon:yes stop_codon:yes gene_type:complete
LSKEEKHNDFDGNIRNRVNSEQHVPPTHLWDDINKDASSYDDSSFDDAIKKKFEKHQTTAPKDLWFKINQNVSRLIKKPYAYLKWAAIPVIVLLLFVSKDYFITKKDLSNNQTKNTESIDSIKENQKKKTKNTFTDKSITDTSKQINEQDLIKENSLSPKKVTEQNKTALKKREKQTNDITTLFKRDDIEKPTLIIENNKKPKGSADSENIKSLKAYLKREQYGTLDTLPHYYQNLEESEIEKLNVSNMKYFGKLKDSIQENDSISANQNIKPHITKGDNQAINTQTDKLDTNQIREITKVNHKIDSTVTNINIISKDSSNIVRNKKDTTDSKTEKVEGIKNISKLQPSLIPRKIFHASIYFSPTYVNTHINKGDEELWKDENGVALMSYENNIDKNEYLKNFYRNRLKGYFGYNFGADLGYNLNNQFAINVGINYFNSKQVFYEQNASYYDLPIRLNTSNSNTSNGTITIYNLTGTENLSSSTVDFYPDTLQDIDTNYYRYEYRETIERKYLNIPITLSYRYIKNRWSFLIEGGMCVAFVYNANYEIYLNQLNTEKQWQRNPKAGRNFVLGTNIGLGMEYALNDKFSLLCMPNFNYSLSNINAENKFRVNPYAFRVSSGIRFRF